MSDNFDSELQALVTGAIIGCLMRGQGHGLAVTVEPITDESGYLPVIMVTGQESGETVKVQVSAI